MALNINRYLYERRIYGTEKVNRINRRLTDADVYSDRFLMAKMALAKELPGHTGCINTLYWSKDGDKLLTGSDDTKLNIYFTYEDYKLVHSINTGHTANIFSAKFMPETSDNIIISGAGDSEIRIFDLNNPSLPLDSMYVCHSDQLKKVCVYENNPFEFLTCSQDGTVRHFDRRVPHECSKHNIRSFIYAQSRPARQFPLPKGDNVLKGCPPPIVDYSKYNIELNSMSINKLFPHYFAVAGLNDYIYLHDRRMLGSSWSQQTVRTNNTTNVMGSLRCVKRFSHSVDGINRTSKHITACQFSRYNSSELIGSWSSNGIFLFNIHDSPEESSYVSSTTFASDVAQNRLNNENNVQNADHTTCETYELSNTKQKKSLWTDIITQFYFEHNFQQTSRVIKDLENYLENNKSDNSIDAAIGDACILIIRAVLYSYQRHTSEDNNNTDQDGTVNEDEEQITGDNHLIPVVKILNTSKENMSKAEQLLEHVKTWQAFWCLSIAYWILRETRNSFSHRKLCLQKASYYLNKAIELFSHQLSSQEAEASTSNAPLQTNSMHSYQLDEIYLIMMKTFKADLDSTFTCEGIAIPNYNSNFTEDLSAHTIRHTWIQLLYITLYSPNDLRQFLNFQQEENEEEEEDDNSINTSSSSSESNGFVMYTNFMDRHIMNLYRRRMMSEDNDNYDLDLEELTVFQEIMRQNFETHVGVVKPRKQYKGHCNIETIKDVDFYGLRDEYIISGSDGGHLFIWDKDTSKIVQILKADNEIVNVAKGHPKLPILAISGIDSTAKIYTPTSRPRLTSAKLEPNNPLSYSSSSLMYDIQRIVENNNENNESIEENIYITRSMIASLSRWGRARRMRRLNHNQETYRGLSEDNDEENDDDLDNISDSDGITLEHILMEIDEGDDSEL
ncbi:WD40-repeat-containing domain protein [Cokeromyces recurvatus]|uniref:WD40-repeat-containing domain protein n=1 Tax=Cokeromyces recurvatus TaxID=90255 RepID=UPI00221F985A|nr:WD40-repeat-containing domain protein [Cokeromyces recurvatus]KAI7907014.1 WD40-repeat-containing domain protein [Cokeromyces recurvatus]